MNREIKHLNVSENIKSLYEYMERLNIKPFSIEIKSSIDYLKVIQVLMKLGFSRDLHWEERMLNKLSDKEFESLFVVVNCVGFSIFSGSGSYKTYKNIREFIKTDDYYHLTQRFFIDVND